MSFMLNIYEKYNEFMNYYAIYEIGFLSLLLVLILFRIKSNKSKINDESNWSSEDRLLGLNSALEKPIPPKSNFTFVIGFFGLLSFIFSLFGFYMSFMDKDTLSILTTLVSFTLWLTIGIASFTLSVLRNKYYKLLYEYHIKWIKNNFTNYIQKAKNLFVIISLNKIYNGEEELLSPFIYTHVRNKKRDWIHPQFFDNYEFSGIFPGKRTSLFFSKKESVLIIDMLKTIKSFYASEFYDTKKSIENDSKLPNIIKSFFDKLDIHTELKNLNYITSNLDDSIEKKSLMDINKDGIEKLFIIFDKNYNFKYEELFYADVVSVHSEDNQITLEFSHGSKKTIESSVLDTELETEALNMIRNVVRQFKSTQSNYSKEAG